MLLIGMQNTKDTDVDIANRRIPTTRTVRFGFVFFSELFA